MQLAIRSLMIGVALVALNLVAVNAVSKPPERYWMRDFSVGFSGPRIQDINRDSITCRFCDLKPPVAIFKGVDLVVLDPPLETLPQTWSPVIASASITLLGLALSLAKPLPLRERAGSRVDQTPTLGPWGGRQVASVALIAIALVGLNFAAAVYRPPLDASGPELARRFFDRSGVYLIKADGDFEYLRRNSDLVFTRSREAGLVDPKPGKTSTAGISQGRGIKVTTIVVKDDGSVIGYGGRSGEVTSDPIVLRPPLRSTPVTPDSGNGWFLDPASSSRRRGPSLSPDFRGTEETHGRTVVPDQG
jgi:hypothetical protein